MSDSLNSPSPSTPRHLKRLSLSVSSSNLPYNSSSSPRTPGSAGGSIGRNSTPLRLSLSGANTGSSSLLNTPSTSTPSHSSGHNNNNNNNNNNTFRTSINSSGSNGSNWNHSEETEISSPSTITNSLPLPLSSNSPSSSPTTTTRPIRQSRRTSSISYSSSRDVVNTIPRDLSLTSSPSNPFVPSSQSHSNPLPILSPILTGRSLLTRESSYTRSNDRYTSPGSNGNLTPPASASLPLNSLDNLQEEQEEHEISLGKVERSQQSSESEGMKKSGGMGLGNPSTLVELNTDLLSFIAKKERKCLDLREELKRHEEELKGLKKKWEIIVAKSVAAATAPPPPPITLTPTKSSDTSSRRTRGTFSSSNNPIPRSPQHALDLALLSSTFDQSNSISTDKSSSDITPSSSGLTGYGTADLELELVENVQAAKAWMGGVFGKVLDAVAGADVEHLPPTSISERRDSALDQVTEEDEEEGEVGEGNEQSTPQKSKSQSISPPSHRSSEASVSSLDDWQPSRASTTSLASADSSSSFFGQFNSSSDRNNSSTRISDNDSNNATTPTLTSQDTFPTIIESERSTSPYSTRSPSLDHSQLPSSRPPTARPRPPSATSSSSSSDQGGHNRRRSTFDMLGSAAGGGWNTLGKKWAQVSVAASGVADSFERRLTETLGPLEGSSPQSSHNSTPVTSPNTNMNTSLPAGVGAGVFSAWKNTAPQVVARKIAEESALASSSPNHRSNTSPKNVVKKSTDGDWDWTSFLDGSNKTPPVTNNTPKASLSRSSGHSSSNRKPSVINLFDDLAAAANGHSPNPSYYSNNNNTGNLPPPLTPTIVSTTSPSTKSPTPNGLPRSNSFGKSAPVRRSTSTPQIDVAKEVDDWNKW